MKKKLLILLLGSTIIYSCNSDDSTVTDNANTLNLNKTIKFSPSQAEYLAGAAESYKQVQYFNDNYVVADTTYDAAGDVAIIFAHSFNNNVHTIEIKNGGNVVNGKNIHTYDSNGRLIEKKSILYNSGMPYDPTSIQTFTYNSDGSITRNNLDPDTGMVMLQYPYYTNSSGLINNIDYLNNSESVINYLNNKPASYQYYNGEVWFPELSFTYYEIPVPANQLKTAVQINNAILLGREEQIAENCNYHLKSYDGNASYDKEFNAEGYLLYNRGSGSIFEESQNFEIFYYYE